MFLSGGMAVAQGTVDDYRRAYALKEKFSADKVFYSNVNPQWIEGTHQFWYVRNTPDGRLYVSVDAIKVKQIVDYMGNNVFNHLDGDISGWLFFFDSTPFANWDHSCKYLLVIDSDNYEVIEYDKGLDENIQMEQIY